MRFKAAVFTMGALFLIAVVVGGIVSAYQPYCGIPVSLVVFSLLFYALYKIDPGFRDSL